METNITALKAFRDKENLSIRQLAKRTGLHYSTISRIENGERNPRRGSGEKIAEALGVPFNAIFFEKEYDNGGE